MSEALEQITPVQTSTNLDDALTVLDSAVAAAVPVLAGPPSDRRPVGWLSHQQILRASPDRPARRITEVGEVEVPPRRLLRVLFRVESGGLMVDRPGRLVWRLLRAPTWLYRLHLGALLGHRFLQLTHHGRRTGNTYRTVVEIIGITAAGEYVVMSGWGRRSDWYRNLIADSDAEIDVGRNHFTACHRELPPTEAVRMLAGYERRNRVIAPLLRRVLSRLLGWPYDGTAAARTRLVEQLPMVALGPAPGPEPSVAPAKTPRARRGRGRAGRWAMPLALTTLIVAGCAGRNQPAAPGPDVGQQLDQTLPAAVLQAPLTTSAGQRVTLASLAGKVVVISDMMTLCQETCPFDTANVVAAARAVEAAGLGDRVEFLSITVDPTRDTTAQIAAYRKLFPHPPTDWLTVTAAPQTLSQLWADLGVYIEKVPDSPPYPRNWANGAPLTYDITHSDEVFALDDTGHERFILEGAPTVSAGTPLPESLRTFLDADGRKALVAPDALAWTLPQELQVLSWLTGSSVPATKS